MTRIPTSLAAAFAGALALAACSQPADTTDTATTDAMATDTAMTDTGTATDAAMTPAAADSHTAQFLTDAMKGDNSEVMLGKLAASKGSSQGVKDLGQMLVDDHGMHKTKVAGLAGTMSIPATDATKPEADAMAKKLQGMSGAAFDKAFVDGTVEDHKKDIAAYEDEANSSDPAPVTSLAKDTVPTLQKHLDKAMGLQKSM